MTVGNCCATVLRLFCGYFRFCSAQVGRVQDVRRADGAGELVHLKNEDSSTENDDNSIENDDSFI